MFVLTNNCFEFKGLFYRQVRGTAMGSPFAPAYANIFMAYLWNNAIAPQLPRPVWLKRFLDDIIALLFIPVVTEDILSLLNSVHSSTKFTMSDAALSREFLDAMVSQIMPPQTYLQINRVQWSPSNPKNLLKRRFFHPEDN